MNADRRERTRRLLAKAHCTRPAPELTPGWRAATLAAMVAAQEDASGGLLGFLETLFKPVGMMAATAGAAAFLALWFVDAGGTSLETLSTASLTMTSAMFGL